MLAAVKADPTVVPFHYSCDGRCFSLPFTFFCVEDCPQSATGAISVFQCFRSVDAHHLLYPSVCRVLFRSGLRHLSWGYRAEPMHGDREKGDGYDRRIEGCFRWVPGQHDGVSEAAVPMDQATISGKDRRQSRGLENRTRGRKARWFVQHCPLDPSSNLLYQRNPTVYAVLSTLSLINPPFKRVG